MGRGHILKKQQALRELKAARKRVEDARRFGEAKAQTACNLAERAASKWRPSLTEEEILALPWSSWDGEYEKQHYWLLLPRYLPSLPGQTAAVNDSSPKGRELVHCWPNAGMMHALDGSGRAWSPDPMLLISPDQKAEG